MKIVVLDGTHNKNGMTSKLVDCFLDGFLSVKDAEIKKFDLLNENIEFCRGCNKCTESKDPVNAECVINDVCEDIKKEALNCDVVVFASPIYEYCVSSAMKRFMERCLTLVTFRLGVTPRAKKIKNKYGVILCCSGAPFPLNYIMGMIRYPNFILKLGCKLFRCSEIHKIFAGAMYAKEDKYCTKARKLGIKVAKKLEK